MRREWREVEFFTEKDGRRRPTGLFWWFAVLIAIVAVGAGLQIVRKIQEDGGDVTPSATIAVAETDEPEATSTETPEPSPTEYVYDDPSTWEFVLRTDPAGTEYWDLQDWQKEQVWHFFEEFWGIYYRADEGLPDRATILSYATGEYIDGINQVYDNLESGEWPGYTYIELDPNDLPGGLLLISNPGDTPVRVEVFFVFDGPLPLTGRDLETGEIVTELNYVDVGSMTFNLVYEDGQWMIEKAE